ncbi:MAG: hypothetical protein JRI72_10405 [Deltaproteobacteria bacterium]|nr:hypothetical protein [Deltaproteobacteria bacterium]
MPDNRILLLFQRKEDNYQLLKKIIDIITPTHGKEFRLKDFLCLDSLSWTDKKNLKDIFGGDYSEISAQEFSFIYQNGKWLYQNTDYRHRFTTKILFLLQNEKEYSIGSIVYPSDLKLIGDLIGKWNEILEKEFGDKELGYDINQEMLDFISNDLKQRVGEVNQLNYGFVKAFLESFYEYDQIVVDNILKDGDHL